MLGGKIKYQTKNSKRNKDDVGVIMNGNRNWIWRFVRKTCLLIDAVEEMVCGKRSRGRKRFHPIDVIKGMENAWIQNK